MRAPACSKDPLLPTKRSADQALVAVAAAATVVDAAGLGQARGPVNHEATRTVAATTAPNTGQLTFNY